MKATIELEAWRNCNENNRYRGSFRNMVSFDYNYLVGIYKEQNEWAGKCLVKEMKATVCEERTLSILTPKIHLNLRF
jgi:hypothetical protein